LQGGRDDTARPAAAQLRKGARLEPQGLVRSQRGERVGRLTNLGSEGRRATRVASADQREELREGLKRRLDGRVGNRQTLA